MPGVCGHQLVARHDPKCVRLLAHDPNREEALRISDDKKEIMVVRMCAVVRLTCVVDVAIFGRY